MKHLNVPHKLLRCLFYFILFTELSRFRIYSKIMFILAENIINVINSIRLIADKYKLRCKRTHLHRKKYILHNHRFDFLLKP